MVAVGINIGSLFHVIKLTFASNFFVIEYIFCHRIKRIKRRFLFSFGKLKIRILTNTILQKIIFVLIRKKSKSKILIFIGLI